MMKTNRTEFTEFPIVKRKYCIHCQNRCEITNEVTISKRLRGMDAKIVKLLRLFSNASDEYVRQSLVVYIF